MSEPRPHEATEAARSDVAALRFSALERQVLRLASRGVSRQELCEALLDPLLSLSDVDEVELRVNDGSRYIRAVGRRSAKVDFQLSTRRYDADGETLPGDGADPGFELLCREVARSGGCPDPALAAGASSCRITDSTIALRLPLTSPWGGSQEIRPSSAWGSLLLVPFAVDDTSHGLLVFKSRAVGGVSRIDIAACEGVAETVSLALTERKAQAALRERVKELTCLYQLDGILDYPDRPLPECLHRIAELLPDAWLHPEAATARIELDGTSYVHPSSGTPVHEQRAVISVRGRDRGAVSVSYDRELPVLDEGPFLKEERALIEAVALKLGLAVAQREAAEEQDRLEVQLRHADRLATIGQLSAGVAHELNEPLANVLGFAQLARKGHGVPPATAADLDKIIQASLHAREVISALMHFARQRPPAKELVDLNKLIEDGLYFLSARCRRAGVELVRRLSPDLPQITADPTQVYQVLVNLVVNAVQAMPKGGTLTIATSATDGWVELQVNDTGIGMSKEVIARIFVPFFTTKAAGEGTGLGLPVVHEIVTGHGGTIEVDSEVGHGARFTVRLPRAG